MIERVVAPEGGDVEREDAPARACTVCARGVQQQQQQQQQQQPGFAV